MSLDNLLQESQNEVERLKDELSDICDVALRYGWNGVENCKILSVFLEDMLQKGVDHRTMLEEIKEVIDVGI